MLIAGDGLRLYLTFHLLILPEAVVFSAVRSNSYGSVGFVSDWRRINVSFTRARRALIVVGNPGEAVKSTFVSSSVLSTPVSLMPSPITSSHQKLYAEETPTLLVHGFSGQMLKV